MTRACRVFLAGEGPSDIGDLSKHHAYREGREGFLQPILRKLTGPQGKLEFKGIKLATIGKTTVKTPDAMFARKAAQSYVLAEADDCDAIVFCCDVDRKSGVKRSAIEARSQIRDLRKSVERGFDDARRNAGAPLTAIIATPCRMIEAWALGDPDALCKVTDRVVDGAGLRRPEDLWGDEGDPGGRHPKRVLERVVGTSPDFADIAESADPQAIERACPLSFAPFAKDVRARLLPGR